MNNFLSFFILSVLLFSAICSCRSSKQSTVQYSDTSSVSATETVSTLSKDEIISLISASRELELSGIKVEFFPPDSAHPDSRAAPKSLSITAAKAKESTQQTSNETATVDEQKTVNLSARSAASLQRDTQNDTDILRPPDWMLLCSIISAIIILFLIFLIKHK